MINRKRCGFTLVEALICILLVSTIGMSSMYVVNGYYKQTFMRDEQLKEVLSNINTIERLKADVHTVHQLYAFSKENDICIIAVGIGEVTLSENADRIIKASVTAFENYQFSSPLQSDYKLFRIEVGGDKPNTKIITILRLEGNVDA